MNCVGDHVRIELPRIIEAGCRNCYQVWHRRVRLEERCAARGAKSMKLVISAVGGEAPLRRASGNSYIRLPWKGQIRPMPGTASFLTISALAVVLENGFTARFKADRTTRASAFIQLGHGISSKCLKLGPS